MSGQPERLAQALAPLVGKKVRTLVTNVGGPAGTLVAVASDHIVIRKDDEEFYLPFGSLLWVCAERGADA